MKALRSVTTLLAMAATIALLGAVACQTSDTNDQNPAGSDVRTEGDGGSRMMPGLGSEAPTGSGDRNVP
jgi:hypothetical protein